MPQFPVSAASVPKIAVQEQGFYRIYSNLNTTSNLGTVPNISSVVPGRPGPEGNDLALF